MNAPDECGMRPLDASATSLLREVAAFAESIARITTMDELAAAVAALVAPLGYTAIASGRLGHTGPPEAFHFARWDPRWLELYLGSGFMRFDPVPMWALRSGAAVTCGELRAMLPKNHPGHQVMEAAAPFGYVGGYILPQRASDNAHGLVAFVGARDPQTQQERVALRALAGIVFEHAEILSGRAPLDLLPPPPPVLTAKERICLKHLVDGKTATQIAKVMRVSEATVRFHSKNLRRKTGAATLAELTALAIVTGLLPNNR